MEITINLSESDLKERCKELLDDFDGVISWEWDSRFNALLTKVPTDRINEIRNILESHLNFVWDKTSIRKAPEIAKKTTGVLGDLRDNQLLFTSDPEGNVFILAAWWPWGNSKFVSVRIFSPATRDQVVGNQGFLAKLKSLFN